MLWVCVCYWRLLPVSLSFITSIYRFSTQYNNAILFSSVQFTHTTREMKGEKKKRRFEMNSWHVQTVNMKYKTSELYSIQFNLSYYRKYYMTSHYIAWHDMIWYDVLSYDINLIIEMMKNENNKILFLTLSGIKVQDPPKPPHHTHTLHTCLISFQSVAYYYRTPSPPPISSQSSSSSSLLSRHFAIYLFISLNQTRIVIKTKKQILLIYNIDFIFSQVKSKQSNQNYGKQSHRECAL